MKIDKKKRTIEIKIPPPNEDGRCSSLCSFSVVSIFGGIAQEHCKIDLGIRGEHKTDGMSPGPRCPVYKGGEQ